LRKLRRAHPPEVATSATARTGVSSLMVSTIDPEPPHCGDGVHRVIQPTLRGGRWM
jgi:hypothetical protein